MFGYVKVNSSELKVREYELYRGTYCGLCHAMGKCTGQCSRMTLNYDFVFLALVRFCLTPCDIGFKQRRCFVHPLKKRNTMLRNSVLDYCSDTSAILNYQKIKDDISDEKGAKKLRALLVRPFVAHSRKKALRRTPALAELDSAIAVLLQELSDVERSESSGVDAPAACFGKLLGEIVACGLEGGERRVAYELGKNIGAWIYIADAIDDCREDMKRGRYNPLLKLYGGRAPDERELELISAALKNHLYGAEAAFDLIDADEGAIKSIIQNILYLGLPERIDGIIKTQTKEQREKESRND